MRPTYETFNHVEAQNSMLRALATRLQLSRVEVVRKKFYPVDALGYSGGQMLCLIESKVRKNHMGMYSTYMISMEKYARALSMADALNCLFVIAVQWSDQLGWHIANRITQPEVSIGGRRDRDDADDVEPVVHIPIDQFQTA